MASKLFTLGLCLFAIDAALSHCLDGWTTFGDSCYFVGHDDLTFIEAQRFCEHFHANLANIETSGENTFIQSYLSDSKDAKHWIGLTDVLVEGLWKHYPSETTATFLAWYPGEPNNGKGANCVAIRADFSYNWTDDPCTSAYKPLCEKPADNECTHLVG